MTSSAVITVYLGADLKARWNSYCKYKGVNSASSAVREVVQFLLSKDGFTQTVTPEAAHGDKTKRIEIRLKPALYAELQHQSQLQGFSPNRLISGLVDVHLAKTPTPLFGQYELDVLTTSNSQLLMLGRNLNQIARQLNISIESSDQLKLELIEEVRKSVNSHTILVSGLIQNNMKRWSIK